MTPMGQASLRIPYVNLNLTFDGSSQRLLANVTPRKLYPGERIPDRSRVYRAKELMDQGWDKYPAARQACREDLVGANLEACERRVVRKYDRFLDPRRLP